MSNPYQPPSEEPHGRSARPWMILSAVLAVALVLMGVISFRAVKLAEVSRAQAEINRRKATITNLKTLGERMHQKEAEVDNE